MKIVVDRYQIRVTINPFFDSRSEPHLDSCGQIFPPPRLLSGRFSVRRARGGRAWQNSRRKKLESHQKEAPGLCRAWWEVGDLPTRLSPSTRAIARWTAFYGISVDWPRVHEGNGQALRRDVVAAGEQRDGGLGRNVRPFPWHLEAEMSDAAIATCVCSRRID